MATLKGNFDGIDFYTVNRDVNGNPRRVVHYLAFLKDGEDFGSVLDDYAVAKKRANELGWSKYRGKDFGGGFVAQCWDELEDAQRINKMLSEL